MLSSYETDEWFCMVEVYEGENFFFAGEWENKNTVLEFIKTDNLEMRAEDIPEFFVFLRDIEKSDAPKSIPTFWLFDFNAEKLS